MDAEAADEDDDDDVPAADEVDEDEQEEGEDDDNEDEDAGDSGALSSTLAYVAFMPTSQWCCMKTHAIISHARGTSASTHEK